MTNTTREEHIKWAKTRALEYVDRGQYGQAIASLRSDLSKHPETQNHPAWILLPTVNSDNSRRYANDVRQFIEGFR